MTAGATGADDDFDARFAYVAHELSNPLMVAQGYAQLLRSEAGGAAEQVRRLADRVTQNLEVAVLLMQRLRDTSAHLEDL